MLVSNVATLNKYLSGTSRRLNNTSRERRNVEIIPLGNVATLDSTSHRGKSSLSTTSQRWPQCRDVTNKPLGNVMTLAQTSRRYLVFKTRNVHTLLSDNSKNPNVLSDFCRCSGQIPSKLYQSSSQPSLAASKALGTS